MSSALDARPNCKAAGPHHRHMCCGAAAHHSYATNWSKLSPIATIQWMHNKKERNSASDSAAAGSSQLLHPGLGRPPGSLCTHTLLLQPHPARQGPRRAQLLITNPQAHSTRGKLKNVSDGGGMPCLAEPRMKSPSCCMDMKPPALRLAQSNCRCSSGGSSAVRTSSLSHGARPA